MRRKFVCHISSKIQRETHMWIARSWVYQGNLSRRLVHSLFQLHMLLKNGLFNNRSSRFLKVLFVTISLLNSSPIGMNYGFFSPPTVIQNMEDTVSFPPFSAPYEEDENDGKGKLETGVLVHCALCLAVFSGDTLLTTVWYLLPALAPLQGLLRS